MGEAIILAAREIGSLALLVGVVLWIIYRLRSEDRRTRLIAWGYGHGRASESTPQRLAAIREQMKLLADYL